MWRGMRNHVSAACQGEEVTDWALCDCPFAVHFPVSPCVHSYGGNQNISGLYVLRRKNIKAFSLQVLLQ